MPERYYIDDPELGTVHIRLNARARHFILRILPDGTVTVTVPPGVSGERLREFIAKNRRDAKKCLQQLDVHAIDWDYALDTPFIRFTLERGGNAGFQLRHKGRDFTLLCPPDTDFRDKQLWLKRIVEEALRTRAKEVLPERIARLSVQAGLPFHSLKINTSKGRWGSCSTRGDINLSCSLMLLPEHLADYVILHELCHTVEMNHSPRFWALLDRFTGDSHALREELSHHHTFTI